MADTIYQTDQTVTLTCSGCQTEQPHTIRSVTKGGKITKAACDDCGTVSTFARGVKTGTVYGKVKAASPYDRQKKYRKGETMAHDHFGHGEVTSVDSSKIDVLFGDKSRRLIHDQ